nr:MAG TPA: hypothetical protein [Caudoviricetes sp.]
MAPFGSSRQTVKTYQYTPIPRNSVAQSIRNHKISGYMV